MIIKNAPCILTLLRTGGNTICLMKVVKKIETNHKNHSLSK